MTGCVYSKACNLLVTAGTDGDGESASVVPGIIVLIITRVRFALNYLKLKVAHNGS